MHDRFVMLKREADLTDEERLNLDGWLKNYPGLGLAYRLKEDFYKIYEDQDPARQRFAALCGLEQMTCQPEIRPDFHDLIRAWRNWQPYILTYFDHPVTNAYTESAEQSDPGDEPSWSGLQLEALRAKILFSEGAFKKQSISPSSSASASRSRQGWPPPSYRDGLPVMERCRRYDLRKPRPTQPHEPPAKELRRGHFNTRPLIESWRALTLFQPLLRISKKYSVP